jgi:hypothetical protein
MIEIAQAPKERSSALPEDERDYLEAWYPGDDVTALRRKIAECEQAMHIPNARLQDRYPEVEREKQNAEQELKDLLTERARHGLPDVSVDLMQPAPANGRAPLTTETIKTVKAWQVFKPQRFPGYSAPLYRLLSEAHRADKPRPTAHDVLEAWRTDRPPEIPRVLERGIDYYDSTGGTKAADLEAIRKTINRMTSARQSR